MKRKLVFCSMSIIIAIGITVYFMAGCATVPKTTWRIWYEMDPTTLSPQTKKGLTIEIEYMDKQKSKALGFTTTRTVEGILGPTTETVALDPFYSKYVTGFRVKITNGMSHILRMKDARIALVVGGKRYPALRREEWARVFTGPEGNPYSEVRVINSLDFNIINDLGVEIYPDPDLPEIGYVAFRIPTEQAKEGTITFFDMTTKVDAAGTPLEKEKFEFKIIQKMEQIQVGTQ